MGKLIRIFDIDDNETLLNIDAITNITVLNKDSAVIVFNSGNYMDIHIDTYINILQNLGLFRDDETLAIAAKNFAEVEE